MGCTLDKFKTYNVGQVRFDRSNGTYTVQISDHVARCPDGIFYTKKGKLVVQAGSNPSLGFDTVTNKPVITVPSEGFIINYGDAGYGFGSFVLLVLGIGILYTVGRFIYSIFSAETKPTYAPPAANVPYNQTANASSGQVTPMASQQPGTTIINNGGGGGSDLLTGVLLANVLSSGGHSHDTTTIIERERVVEHDHSNNSSSNNDVSSSDSSSEDNSFSSDSSDSSSDYDSDSSSSSDYSSDSSSGGSDFSSDN